MVNNISKVQKQPSRAVLRKRCSENMQQIYSRTPMSKCDFNKVTFTFIEIALRHGCSPVNSLHIFRTSFPKNASEGLLLEVLTTNVLAASLSLVPTEFKIPISNHYHRAHDAQSLLVVSVNVKWYLKSQYYCLIVVLIINLKSKIFHFKTTITTTIGHVSCIGEFFRAYLKKQEKKTMIKKQ